MHKCVVGGSPAVGAFVDCRECQNRVAILELQVDEAGTRLREAERESDEARTAAACEGDIADTFKRELAEARHDCTKATGCTLGTCYILSENERLERERDEAQAQVERVKALVADRDFTNDELEAALGEKSSTCPHEATIQRIDDLILSWQIVTRPEIDIARDELIEARNG